VRLLRVLALVAAVFALGREASAAPIYHYTFTGTVTSTTTYDPTTGYQYDVPVNGLGPGDSVSYTFVVDLGQQAVSLYGYPTPTTSYVWMDDAENDYILASYGSGDAFPRTPLDGNYYNGAHVYGLRFSNGTNATGRLYDYRYAEDLIPPGGTYSPLRYDTLDIYGSCYSCSPYFQVGQTFSGFNTRYAQSTFAAEQYDQVVSSLTLTHISGDAVPEPGTLLLLGGGLLGLTRVRRRK
jgi:hypothetical protein